jgi:hypothetical protein
VPIIHINSLVRPPNNQKQNRNQKRRKEQERRKGGTGMQQNQESTAQENPQRKKKQKSIIITTLIIHLRSHNHHPNQKDQSNDPESECSIPLRANTVLLKPSQCIDGDATDVVVVDVAVAVGVYIALFSHQYK